MQNLAKIKLQVVRYFKWRIYMISTIGNISAIAHSNYSSGISSPISFSGVGKLYVPVNPALVGYAQFEHVAGVASENGSSGVNISKIQVLNTLIDRLLDMKQKPKITQDNSELSDTQVDALIKEYQSRIKGVINVAQGNPYALGGAPSPQAGALFSIAA